MQSSVSTLVLIFGMDIRNECETLCSQHLWSNVQSQMSNMKLNLFLVKRGGTKLLLKHACLDGARNWRLRSKAIYLTVKAFHELECDGLPEVLDRSYYYLRTLYAIVMLLLELFHYFLLLLVNEMASTLASQMPKMCPRV